jgi:hypothetical protein
MFTEPDDERWSYSRPDGHLRQIAVCAIHVRHVYKGYEAAYMPPCR